MAPTESKKQRESRGYIAATVFKICTVGMLLASVLSTTQNASATPGYPITYHGRIMKPDGRPVSGTNVQFKIQIRSPDLANCLLFEELRTLNMSNTNGSFAISVNDGGGTRQDSTALEFSRLFANTGSMNVGAANCDSGSGIYSPLAGDGRRFQVEFRDETMPGWEPLPPQALNFVPMAISTVAIGEFGFEHLLRVEGPSGPALAPALTPAQATNLVNLVNGTSSAYTKSGELNGVALPTLTNGQVASWNGSAWSGITPITTELDPLVQTFAKTALPACSPGEVLSTLSGSFQCVSDATTGTPVDATTAAKGIVRIDASGGIAVSSGVISLASAGVQTSHLAAGAVDSSKILNGTILTEDIADAQVTNDKIQSLAVDKVSSSGGKYFGYQPNGVACADQQVLKWNLSQARWECGAGSSTTLTNGSIWIGNGSNQAQAVAPSGDVAITNAGVMTVTHMQGRSIASTAPVLGQVLKFSTVWEPSNFSVADLRRADGVAQFSSANCTAGQTLTWSSLSDLFSCSNISITKSQVSDLGTIGTAASKNFGTAAGQLVELDVAGKIPASLLPALSSSRSENSNTAEAGLTLVRTRADSTSPGIDLGALIQFNLEGFVDGDIVNASKLSSVWETAQVDNVGSRRADFVFENLFNNTMTERLRVKANGKIGIGGVKQPTYHIEFLGTSARTIGVGANTFLAAAGQDLTLIAGSPRATVTDHDGGTMFLSAGPSTGTGTSKIEFQTSASGPTGFALQTPTTKMKIDGAGNVGIGVDATTKLQVAGVISASADNTYSLGTSALRFTDVYVASGVVNTSDRRQKKEIRESDLGLDFILGLNPVSYVWKNGEDHSRHYGLIAQDVDHEISKKVSGERTAIVHHDLQTDRFGVRYTELIAPLIKAIQEMKELFSKDSAALSKQLEALSRENETLKTQVNLMKQEQTALKRLVCKSEPNESICQSP